MHGRVQWHSKVQLHSEEKRREDRNYTKHSAKLLPAPNTTSRRSSATTLSATAENHNHNHSHCNQSNAARSSQPVSRRPLSCRAPGAHVLSASASLPWLKSTPACPSSGAMLGCPLWVLRAATLNSLKAVLGSPCSHSGAEERRQTHVA